MTTTDATASEAARRPAQRRVRLTIAYDGGAFHGWQRQPELRTVQLCLEQAIARIAREPASLVASGRTDAGVHALGQVAHFDTSSPIPTANLLRALNDWLPPEVRIMASEEASPSFHARYDARSKLYRYRVLQAEICSPFASRYVWHYPCSLNRRDMAQAARTLIGEHDFTSFAASAEQDEEPAHPGARSQGNKSMVRRITASRILWSEKRQMLVYEVEGSGFLHHMVRNMVGTLMEVGRGGIGASEMTRILRARDRAKAGPTAPPQGLCLVRVSY